MLIQAVTLAYFTGLRASEVYRIQSGGINHCDLTLKVHVTKTGKRDRLIAVPQWLSIWAQAHDWQSLNQTTIQHRMIALSKHHPALSGLCMATFRKNYADMMIRAGANALAVDAHQGRTASVLERHYLRDPYFAVNVMRPVINNVWQVRLAAVSLLDES